MSKLVLLDLWRCGLTGMIPDAFGELLNWRVVYLHNNRLHVPVPPSFNCLSSLAILELSNNRMTGCLPELSNLNALTDLMLENNQLTGPIPTTIGSQHNHKLGESLFSWHSEQLNIWRPTHRIVTGSTAGIGALSCLEALEASHNDITAGIPPSELSQLTQLQSLHLFGNPRLYGAGVGFHRIG
ncbi:hypothetical protein CcCBS67573_g09900 [Chytriomyces confervae]|uniref:Uncharacterized protein n=1 Tax=Chytriomyces confervae TaxID=246404 RepID=A0A507DL01_9FUNG|nr:hypothetical protein CcCBS67573_g09900 [Chytriomyces confervae]